MPRHTGTLRRIIETPNPRQGVTRGQQKARAAQRRARKLSAKKPR